jgi:hypothetical protein
MPKVELNSQAPDFTLNDYQGNHGCRISGKKHVVLVFNRGFSDRSAGAHGQCAKITRFVRRGAEVVVGPENGGLPRGAQERRYELPGSKNNVLKLYGREVNLFKLGGCQPR